MATVASELPPPMGLLSPNQVETLRHVYGRKNSKEIARIMQVSPHTVDERVRKSLKILGVPNRMEAAQRLASYGIFDQVTLYQSLTYQTVKLSLISKTTEGGSRHKEVLGRQVDLGSDTFFGPAATPAGGWMKRFSWPVLVVATGFLAFTFIHFLLVSLGRNLA